MAHLETVETNLRAVSIKNPITNDGIMLKILELLVWVLIEIAKDIHDISNSRYPHF